MRHLKRVLHRGPRKILLLGVIILLPALALALLAFRTLQGEQVREEYRRKERQQQILRLLESDLSDRILSRRDAADNTFAFEVRRNRIFLPRLNVYLSPGYRREVAARLSSRDAALWRDAQALEFGGRTAEAVRSYRRLLARDRPISVWSKLALLRMALQRADSSDAAARLKEILSADPAAMTESGIPVRVAAALLVIEHGDSVPPSDMAAFLSRTLPGLTDGDWLLNAAQWIYYARKIALASDAAPELRERALATADFLEFFASAAGEVLAMNEDLEWRHDRPFAARYLPAFRSVALLFPGKDRNTGCVLAGAELCREAEAGLASLTAAEDFEGRVEISGNGTEPAALSMPAFPFLKASFPERNRMFWRSHLRRYFVFYETALLLLGAAAGLFFTYRAVAREMELGRMKAGFVASVSHEFRTPLAAIEALLERLESGKVRDVDMLQRYYGSSRREVQRLTAMVNQLLDFSRLEEGRVQLRFETVDLNRLAEDSIQSFRNLGFGARLTDGLNRESPLNIPADGEAAGQCIHNLIDNALKYSPDGSPVTIVSGRRDGKAFLQVSDHGPGIARGEQARIFEQFYRSAAGAAGVQGTGIGLALVKTVMQAHGGEVTLESRPGEGSTFELVFPEARE